jgi:hypothetical protein
LPDVMTARLFLYYSPQVDHWLISDSPEGGGSVTADCGPVGADGEDLGQHWRVWDGESWRQDRNIHSEVALGGLGFEHLKGLRIVQQPLKSRHRAHSQEPRGNMHLPELPELREVRAPADSMKPLASARQRRHLNR